MPKRKILFINDSLWSGSGVFRSLQQILNHIRYDKFDVTLFVCPGGPTEPEMLSRLPEEVNVIVGSDDTHYYRSPDVAARHLLDRGARMLRLTDAAERLRGGTRQRIHEKKIRLPAQRYFRDVHFDVLVANTVPLCSEVARYIRADRKYVIFHSSKADFFPDLTLEALKTFDGMVAVGEGVRDVLLTAYPAYRDRIRTITNFVDAEPIRKLADRTPLPERGAKPILCTCGRLSREKGFDLAVESARILRGDGFDFVWYFVGDGPERKKIEAMIAEYGLGDSITITGFLQNPYPYIKNCDLYLQPSYEEAQPLALTEARILGRAIVSTDTVGGRAVLSNGETGVLTPISAEGLAGGIAALLRDPDRRASLENLYTEEDRKREKQAFETAWDRLLSGQEDV